MDGLALLCTLHADGPATLKRLRSAGCPNLTALLELPITDLALALDVAPAAARRLLREARLLAERVGPELEAEEGPAPVSATPVAATKRPGPLALELPPVTSASTLDQGDRALLERIVREGRAARPAGEPILGAGMASAEERSPEIAPPGLAPAPTALERVGLDLSAEGPWPTTAPESVTGDEQYSCDLAPNALALRMAPSGGAAADLRPLLELEGVDAALSHDLAHAGLHTLDDLARADALTLARELRVTFAQAKRLCFLARRAAQPNQPTPAWRIAPRSQPLVSTPEHPTAPRARFWEPRTGAGIDAPGSFCEPQGVPVDPSEVDRPRRITDVRRAPTPTVAGQADARQLVTAPATTHLSAPVEQPPTGGTVLGWNFEIPRAEPSPEPEPVSARRTWRPLEADESSAGPFA